MLIDYHVVSICGCFRRFVCCVVGCVVECVVGCAAGRVTLCTGFALRYGVL